MNLIRGSENQINCVISHIFPPKSSNSVRVRKPRLPYRLLLVRFGILVADFVSLTTAPAMVSSAVTFAERRRVASTVDVDSGELNREKSVKNVVVAGENGRRRLSRPPPSRQRSFREDINHIAAETYLITQLAFTLLRYLG